jgi:hypothetical protein
MTACAASTQDGGTGPEGVKQVADVGRIAPGSGGRSPMAHSTVVVFPAPFGPRMPEIYVKRWTRGVKTANMPGARIRIGTPPLGARNRSG